MQVHIRYPRAVTPAPDPRSSRRYDNSSRRAQARRSRARLVDAARALFVEQGYEATTLTQVARQAGVSVPTIQKTFGTKAALAKAVYDVTLAGDDEPVPMGERQVFQQLAAETDAYETLRLYAQIGRDLWSRLGELFPMILAGSMNGEPDLVALRLAIARESRIGAEELVDRLAELNGLRRGLHRDEAVDILWWLIQPEQYIVLVGQAGWTLDRYVDWFHHTAERLLLNPPS